MEKNEIIKFRIDDDYEFYTTISKKYKNRKRYVVPNPKMIESYIPGAILDVMVKEGEAVKAGQSVLILESMKMANLIKSPADGKIKKINVKKGEKIAKGIVMIELA
jgi:biotin carboxyl carrier protein